MTLSSGEKIAIAWVCTGIFNIYLFIASFDQTNVTNQKANLAAKILFGLAAVLNFAAALQSYLYGPPRARLAAPLLPLHTDADVAVAETLTLKANNAKEKGGQL